MFLSIDHHMRTLREEDKLEVCGGARKVENSKTSCHVTPVRLHQMHSGTVFNLLSKMRIKERREVARSSTRPPSAQAKEKEDAGDSERGRCPSSRGNEPALEGEDFSST